ncbi:hypothetical protein Dimus_031551 [Dionaea muscipula]
MKPWEKRFGVFAFIGAILDSGGFGFLIFIFLLFLSGPPFYGLLICISSSRGNCDLVGLYILKDNQAGDSKEVQGESHAMGSVLLHFVLAAAGSTRLRTVYFVFTRSC